MTDSDPYERKDFNDFLVGDMTPDNSPEYRAFMADVSPWLANFDFSELDEYVNSTCPHPLDEE